MKCNEKVINNVNKVALQRGPIIYCSESMDFENEDLSKIYLANTSKLISIYNNNPNHASVIIKSNVLFYDDDDKANKKIRLIPFRAFPYYGWAHRGNTQMKIWYNYSDNYN